MYHNFIKFLSFIMILTGFAKGSHVRVIGPHAGSCPEVVPMEDFHRVAFQGIWNLVAGYNVETAAASGNCASTNFVLRDANSIAFYFFNKALNSEGQWSWTNGTGVMANPDEQDGMLHVAVKWKSVPYFVIDTDYKTYAIVYTCWTKGNFHNYSIWILSRDKVLNREDFPVKQVTDLLKITKLRPQLIDVFDQSECPN